jgi:hypothetical protein
VARFYSNENFPLPTVDELRRLGHDVLTSRDAGNAGRAVLDPEVFAFAISLGRAVLINRRHFIKLHLSGTAHHGIIACSFDPNFIALASRIDHSIAALTTLENQLVRVNRPNI